LNDIDESFQSVFYNNNILAHKKLLDVFYHAYKNSFDNAINITGTMGNGLARVYMRIPKRVKTNAETISKIIGYQNIDYIKKVLTIWLDDALDICNEYNINILDLYQMEQDNAHWGSLTASEQDIVREEMRPFNSRKLIYTFWSLEDKYRYQLNPVIYKKIIEKNWKQALSIPVNPSLRSNIIKILRFFNIEQPIYHLYKSLKFNLE
jgi:hypothetical protein